MAKTITLLVEHEMEDHVYLKTDVDQELRIVTGYRIIPDKTIIYLLTCGVEETPHYDFEITKKKTQLV